MSVRFFSHSFSLFSFAKFCPILCDLFSSYTCITGTRTKTENEKKTRRRDDMCQKLDDRKKKETNSREARRDRRALPFEPTNQSFTNDVIDVMNRDVTEEIYLQFRSRDLVKLHLRCDVCPVLCATFHAISKMAAPKV